MSDPLVLLILAMGGVAFAYAFARAASLGWYRSKYEHFLRVMALTEKEENGNGKE